jgi:hypothetical protein
VAPGFGLEKEDSGVINGIAAYQTASGGSIPGQLAQFLTPKYGGTRWFVRYHKARGFKFEDYNNRDSGDDPAFYHSKRWAGRVCGDTPYGVPWKGESDVVFYGQGPSRTEREWVFSPGVPTRDYYQPNQAMGNFPQEAGYYYDILLLPEQRKVRITSNAYGNNETHTDETALEEDLSCPEN